MPRQQFPAIPSTAQQNKRPAQRFPNAERPGALERCDLCRVLSQSGCPIYVLLMWYVSRPLPSCPIPNLLYPIRDCPRCKVKRRATKTLSLARLPPILVIHLKRFEANGRFSDKVDTFVDFPVKSLDLTELMPPPLPAGADHSLLNGGVPMSRDDPRTQVPPYKYDLYGVTNHYGNLSSGHCE